MEKVSRFEAVELIRTWGHIFDAHASPQVVYDIVAGEDFVMRFGNSEMKGMAGLEEHHALKEMFYKEIHHYYDFQVERAGPPLVLGSQMVWDTHRRTKSGQGEHLIADLRHRWTFTRNAEDQPVILVHELVSMNYRKGYTPSDSDSKNLHIDNSRVGFGSNLH